MGKCGIKAPLCSAHRHPVVAKGRLKRPPAPGKLIYPFMMIISTLAAGLWAASLGAAAPAPFGSTSQLGALARRDSDLGSLLLIVKAQDDVNDPDDLTVSSCLLNNGNTTLKVLNDPNGPLSTWKTHTFEFYEVPASGTGLKARAGGGTAGVSAVRVKYNPEVVAALSDPNTYTELKPGENKTVLHDLSGMYNFQTTGEYAVRLTSNAEYMRIIKDDGTVGYIQAKMYDGVEAANWTATHVAEAGTYASMRGLINAGIPNHGSNTFFRRWEDEPNLLKRQTYNNCSAAQQKDIEDGVTGANAYIDEVNKYLGSAYYLGNARYRTWFGPYTKTRWDTVKSHFTALHGQPARFRYDCSCTEADTFAFVYPNQFGTVYLCGAFWKTTTLGQDSRAGTIIHEATHFTTIAGTDDHAYGHEEAQKLAANFPDQAVMNADSHEYFAENTPEII